MKNPLTLLFIFAMAILAFGCHNSDTFLRKEMPFENYSFTRDSVGSSSYEFLMGNGEMGGRVHLSGLGVEKLWFSDYWKNPKQREYLPGLLLTSSQLQPATTESYRSELNIDKALCVTRLSSYNQLAYEAKLFFSFDDVHLLGLIVTNTSDSLLSFDVVVPDVNFILDQRENGTHWFGTSTPDYAYNQISWALRSNIPLLRDGGRIQVSIPKKSTLQLAYSVVTEHDAIDHLQSAIDRAGLHADVEYSFSKHYEEWKRIRHSIGSIIIPDGEYAKWYYRSIYTNYATAGSEKFLAAETQFAYPEADWDMHAFTYGHGVWAAMSFLQMGDSVRAKRSLQWLYQPASLIKNVSILIPDTGRLAMTYHSQPVPNAIYFTKYPEGAMAFAHEQTDRGENITYDDDSHWDMQFHLNGFATSIFHRYATYYHDPGFEQSTVYPLARGTGLFWRGLLKQDSSKQSYYLPPMLSLSENIVKCSVLDAVLSAKWNLSIADYYEKKYRSDQLSLFAGLADSLYVPQNDSIFLEYLNDNQKRLGGGYFGIRACAYLGFPLYEQIPTIDKVKARRTLDHAWNRNGKGRGMISFIANWFALTEACFGNGDLALDKSSITLRYRDEGDVQLHEAFAYKGDSIRARFNPYFLTGYSSLSLVPISMVIQSYSQTLYFFPAIPSSWKNIEFYDMPVEGGYRVSGIYRGEKDFEIQISRNGRMIRKLNNVKSLRFSQL